MLACETFAQRDLNAPHLAIGFPVRPSECLHSILLRSRHVSALASIFVYQVVRLALEYPTPKQPSPPMGLGHSEFQDSQHFPLRSLAISDQRNLHAGF
jgi:hypothetical protein